MKQSKRIEGGGGVSSCRGWQRPLLKPGGRVGVSHVDIWGRALQAEGTVRSKALSWHIVGKEQEGSHFS